jgi:hypothetical protein
MTKQLISSPLHATSCPDFPIVQYVDDTLVLMKADTQQLMCLKALLNTFATATGLKVNYNKSNMVPINISEERTGILINTMDCKRGAFPHIPWSASWAVKTYCGVVLTIGSEN